MLCLYDLNSVLEKDPVGLKVLEKNVFVSNSEIKAEKEQPDNEYLNSILDVVADIEIDAASVLPDTGGTVILKTTLRLRLMKIKLKNINDHNADF